MNPSTKNRLLVYTLIYLLFGLFLFFRQRSMIYFPAPFEAHPYPEETFTNQGEKIRVIVLNPGKTDAIMYFGGNAENVVFSARDFKKTFPACTVYLFNYRGYGGSSGQPSERNIFSDALAFYDTFASRHRSVSLLGRSLGSGVACYLASERSVSRLALVTPFDSITRMAQRQFPIYPIPLLLLDKFNSISRVSKIKADTLVIRGGNDRVIKARHTQHLVSAFPEEQISVFTIDNASHNDIQNFPEYYQKIKEFLNIENTKQL